MKTSPCPSATCGNSKVVRHGFSRTKSGKAGRYRGKSCGWTFGSTTGTPCFGLQRRRSAFDEVAELSVEGVSKSAIARVEGLAWIIVHRRLWKAAGCCRQFDDRAITEIETSENQADGVRTSEGSRNPALWIFTVIDVTSRPWPAALVGRRSDGNTRKVFGDLRDRTSRASLAFIVTDGFEYHDRVVREVFGTTCLHGQVLKTRRGDRVVKVERRDVMGSRAEFEEALSESEDLATLNACFVERINLTVRHGSAYLARRVLSHRRWRNRLVDHRELLRCHYDLVRPRRALRSGHEIRTPAMLTGLTRSRLSLRDIFCSQIQTSCPTMSRIAFRDRCEVFRLAA